MPTNTITAHFDVTGWVPNPLREPLGATSFDRVTVTKTFTGAVSGESTAELLTAANDVGASYVANEVFTGTIDGRTGSIVIAHGGVVAGTESESFGAIVPGSGTDGLAGCTGQVRYNRDADGVHTVDFDFD